MAPHIPTPKDSRRRYPRADLRVKARLWSGSDAERHFDATLESANISVGGIFFRSTFFLKIGEVLDVEFSLPPHGRQVHCRGPVVRVENFDATGKVRSGFAVKFDEYLDNSEVVLANYFLAPVLRDFMQSYVKKHHLQASAEEVAQMVDVLAAWELTKARGDVSLLTDTT